MVSLTYEMGPCAACRKSSSVFNCFAWCLNSLEPFLNSEHVAPCFVTPTNYTQAQTAGKDVSLGVRLCLGPLRRTLPSLFYATDPRPSDVRPSDLRKSLPEPFFLISSREYHLHTVTLCPRLPDCAWTTSAKPALTILPRTIRAISLAHLPESVV